MTTESKSKWWSTMIAKYGSVQAVREFMAASAKKAKQNGTGGFAYMKEHDPEKLRAISRAGGKRGKRT